ncbi:MAG TPA: TlpA disulfide reductase family protein [Bacteroidales bacterium]|nr:TlpA disulfide reductase family protein [Bacteroidales bacterium]
MRVTFFWVLFILYPMFIHGEQVMLKGNISEYTDKEISFFTYDDQITYTEKKLCSTLIDENGDFTCTFEITQTTPVFVHLGIYEAYVFVEPAKTYELLFPEIQEKKLIDELNPYFEPVLYHLGIEETSENELNYQLAFFDEVYSKMINENAYLIYSKSNKLDVSKELSKVDSIFADFDHPFFNDFKTYRFASFRHLSYQEKSKSISNTYYLNNEILYHNPAYMELFNQVYDEYFQYFSRTNYGEQIYKDIEELKSITALKNTLGRDSVLTNDTLKELVILKCLHDEFYNDDFSRSAMLVVLDSLAMQTKSPEHQKIAQNIRTKVTKLMIGFKPPAFNLYNKDSNLISLDTFRGKYVYLGFCTTVSYACIQEFDKLQRLAELHQEHYEIVVISMDESLTHMKRFVEKKDYTYTFLHYGNQPEVFKNYDIRAFPTYYFIDKEGRLSMSPAPAPDENLEQYIFQKLKNAGDL